MKFDFLSESDQAYFIHKASTLVEALPFIRQHSGDTIVIKYGGHAMGNSKLSKSFAKSPLSYISLIISHPPINSFLTYS